MLQNCWENLWEAYIEALRTIQKIFGPKSLHFIEPDNECVYHTSHVNHVNYEHTEHSWKQCNIMQYYAILCNIMQYYAENHELDSSLFYQLSSDLSKYTLKLTVLKIWSQETSQNPL